MMTSALELYLSTVKNKVVEEFDFANKKVKYTKNLKGRSISSFTPEEQVRSYLLSKLVNELDYEIGKIEIETEYPVGRKKDKERPRVDVIVRDNEGKAFLLIEVKEPDQFEKEKEEAIENQLFNLAPNEDAKTGVKYLAYYTYEITGETIKDKVIIIDFEKFKSYESWEKVRDFSDEIPKRYDIAQKQPYCKGSDKDLEKNFTHEQIDGIRVNLHNVLWGGGGTDDNEVFSSLVNIILAKIQDESEKRNGDQYDFQILADVKDNAIESDDVLFERINLLYQRALKQRMNVSKVEDAKVIDVNKFSLSKLKYTVQTLESYSFVDGKNSFTGKDILGDFFEGIIREGFKQSKGQFFTHINVVRFLLWGLQVDKLAIERVNKDQEIPYMIDPSSGSGTFLIEYMKFITENLKRRFKDQLATSRDVEDKFDQWFKPDHRENKWAKDYIYGSDINFNLGTATKVNMILHGDGSTNIFVGSPNGDGLLPFTEYNSEKAPNVLNNSLEDSYYNDKKVNKAFDVIVTNPPFSVDLDKDTKRKLNDGFLFSDKKNSENLFIERYYQLLRDKGRLGVVLPESVFDTSENKYIRLFIYKYFNVKAIISLPQVTFEPYTSTKTSLLFAQKKTPEEISEWNVLWEKYGKEWEKLKKRVEKELELLTLMELLDNFGELSYEEKDELYKQIKKCYQLKKSDKDSLDQKSFSELEELLSNITLNSKWSIASENEEQRKNNILYLLNVYDSIDENLSIIELVKTYRQELTDLITLDKDTKEVFGFVNTWWVFNQVAKELSYSIFMAEVDNVGYKRTKRAEKEMPNDLYDLEIAPQTLDKMEVMEPLLSELTSVLSQIENLKKNETKKSLDELGKLETKRLNLEREIAELEVLIDKLYDDGKLKDEYFDRIQQGELQSVFLNPYLKPFISHRVALRSGVKIKVLDYLREVKWQ